MTICAKCKHCSPSTGPGRWANARCLASVLVHAYEEINHVSGRVTEHGVVYRRCENVNDGDCKLYEPLPAPDPVQAEPQPLSLWRRIWRAL